MNESFHSHRCEHIFLSMTSYTQPRVANLGFKRKEKEEKRILALVRFVKSQYLWVYNIFCWSIFSADI